MNRDYFQDALGMFNVGKIQWYGFKTHDDDGNNDIRLYYLSELTRVYNPTLAGTVDYHEGIISLFPMSISSVSNVNGAASTKIVVTSIPDSYDVVPVRNQILELDLVNTSISATVDAISSTGLGYTVTNTATGSTTTVSTPSSTASISSSSGY